MLPLDLNLFCISPMIDCMGDRLEFIEELFTKPVDNGVNIELLKAFA